MNRIFSLVTALTLAGCIANPDSATNDPNVTDAEQGLQTAVLRERVSSDVYHYVYTLRVGTSPNAKLRVHRIVRERRPGQPAPTGNVVMMLHGSFANFVTNFAPALGDASSPATGLGPYLAEHDVDVWGLDRRWTNPIGADADVSDFANMGVAQEVGDVGRALAFARFVRAATGAGTERFSLVGFSNGGQLAYLYAAKEAALAPALRHVKALVPIDIYAALGPDQAAEREAACANAAWEYDAVAQGMVDATNDFTIAIGELARSAPDAPSPYFDATNNRDALLIVAGQTYQFIPFTPLYHLAAPILDGNGAPTGFRESSAAAIAAWFANASLHQSMREAADFDALLCGAAPLPIDAPLQRITVPLFYLGAAGGFGTAGYFSTAATSSRDITKLNIQRLADNRTAEDFGHGDLLYSPAAATAAWLPLATWLRHH